MNTILGLGFVLLVGVLCTRLIGKLRFPAVTAYLIVGIFIGPSFLKQVPDSILSASGLISNIVLGLIAFSIGRNFSIKNFKSLGSSILWISILEAVGAWVFVTLSFLLFLKQPFYVSLLFGAIASATAPAATVMVIRQYRAKGNFTNTLLGVVAIDDAWCLIIFAVSLALSKSIYIHETSTFFLLKVVFHSISAIAGAFILGLILAVVFSIFSKYIPSPSELVIYTLGFILFTVGTALSLNLSVLLSCMFFGVVFVNINLASFRFFDAIQAIESPLYLLFFVLAGANLEIQVLKNLGLLGLTYIVFRISGKVLGAYWGAAISKADEPIRKYIGWGLIPQAGVALGCALIVKSDFQKIGNMLYSTIIATTVVYELIGPLCTKYALKKSGEIMFSND